MNPIANIGKRGKAIFKRHMRRRRNSASDPPEYEDVSIYNEAPPPYTEFNTLADINRSPAPPAYTPSDPHVPSPLHERLHPIERNGEGRIPVRSTPGSPDQVPRAPLQSSSPGPLRRTSGAPSTTSDPPSWTECIRWIAQYSLESNFRTAIRHFHSMVQKALRTKQRQENPSPFLLHLVSIPASPPPSLIREQWEKMVMGLGFEIPRSHRENSEALPEYIVIPARISNTELVLYTIIFQGIMELPFNIVRMVAYIRKDELDQILYLLSFVVSHPDHHSLPKDDYLLQPVWDLHRRPGCLLREMGFQEAYHSDGRRSVLFPRSDVKRQWLQLVTDILRTFQYGDTTRVILV